MSYAWARYCYVTELYAYDFIIKDFVIKRGVICAGISVYVYIYSYIKYIKNIRMKWTWWSSSGNQCNKINQMKFVYCLSDGVTRSKEG